MVKHINHIIRAIYTATTFNLPLHDFMPNVQLKNSS